MPTLELESLVLAKGSHNPDEGEACVMEAVAFVAGEPWSDSPTCASPVIAAFLRRWNDDLSDTTTRRSHVNTARFAACGIIRRFAESGNSGYLVKDFSWISDELEWCARRTRDNSLLNRKVLDETPARRCLQNRCASKIPSLIQKCLPFRHFGAKPRHEYGAGG
jgi:hypothetical protein